MISCLFRFKVRKIQIFNLNLHKKLCFFKLLLTFFLLKAELYLSSGIYFFLRNLLFHFTCRFFVRQKTDMRLRPAPKPILRRANIRRRFFLSRLSHQFFGGSLYIIDSIRHFFLHVMPALAVQTHVHMHPHDGPRKAYPQYRIASLSHIKHLP